MTGIQKFKWKSGVYTENPTLPYILLTALFFISRLIFFICGVRFYAGSVNWYMQFADIELLKTNLIESLWYFHFQPPLFNLFMGLLVKIFPENFRMIATWVYCLMGLGLTLTTYVLLVRLGCSRSISIVLTGLFIISPSVIAYENFMIYTYPLALLLCLSAIFLHRFIQTERFGDVFVFFCCLSSISLIRSLYHLLWIFVIIGVLLLAKPKLWKKTISAILLPVGLVIFVYAKTFILFSSVASSTMMGPELARMTIFQIPQRQVQRLVIERKISPMSTITIHNPAEHYRSYLPLVKTGVPILDKERKSCGEVNYFHLSHALAARQYLKDALYVLRHYPLDFLEAFKRSMFIYLIPGPSKDIGEGENASMMRLIAPFEVWYNRLILGQWFPKNETWTYFYKHPDYEAGSCLFWLIIFPVLLVFIAADIIKQMIKRKGNLSVMVTTFFMWFTTVYITLVSTLFSFRTNNRYRFPIEVFVVVFIGLAFMYMLKRIKKEDTSESHQDLSFNVKWGEDFLKRSVLIMFVGFLLGLGILVSVLKSEAVKRSEWVKILHQFPREYSEQLKKFRHRGPFLDDFLNRGTEYYRLGRLDKALAYFNKVLELDPDYSRGYNHRACIYFQKGNTEKALLEFNKSLMLDPHYAEGYHNRAIVYVHLNNPHAALRDYNRALVVNPYYRRAYFNRSQLYYRMGKYRDALKDANRARALGHADLPGYINQLKEKL